MTKEMRQYLEDNILYFPEFLAGTREANIEVEEMRSKLDSEILEYILDYAKMEADPKSMELHDHFDRETCSISQAVITRHMKITPSEGDDLALMWAKRKMGVSMDVCVPN